MPSLTRGLPKFQQATDISPGLFRINMTRDRAQLTVFFVQETALSLLYIWQARKYLRSSSLLAQPNLKFTSGGSSSTLSRPVSASKQVLLHLVFANILVIALDIVLLGVQDAGLFYLQGAFKRCVYGVKLKVEFAILNRLVETVRMRMRGRQQGAGSYYQEGSSRRGGPVPSQGRRRNLKSRCRAGRMRGRRRPAELRLGRLGWGHWIIPGRRRDHRGHIVQRVNSEFGMDKGAALLTLASWQCRQQRRIGGNGDRCTISRASRTEPRGPWNGTMKTWIP